MKRDCTIILCINKMHTSKFEPSLALQLEDNFCHEIQQHHLEIENRPPEEKCFESSDRKQSP